MEHRLGTELIHLDEVVVMVGEIDASTAPLLLRRAARSQQWSNRLMIDVAGVTFTDFSAPHVLTQQRQDATTVVVRNASGQVRRLLEITGLSADFQEPVLPHAHDEPGATTEATGLPGRASTKGFLFRARSEEVDGVRRSYQW